MDRSSYDENKEHMKKLAVRMRSGTGVGRIISGEDSQTHYMDALQRFKKDYSSYDHQKRQEERIRRQRELEKKRIEILERQNKRWEVTQEMQNMKEMRMKRNFEEVMQGKKKTATSNGLAYNPINLTYDNNAEGERLRLRDEDHKIRGLVRAANMDSHGNGLYNPLNGQQRSGVDKIIPPELNQKYHDRLYEFEESRRVRVPQTSNDTRRNIFQYY